MPDFTPKPTNFYGKSLQRPVVSPNQSVQQAGTKKSGNDRSARGVQNRPLPGVRPTVGFNNTTAFLQAITNPAILNTAANLIDTALNPATAVPDRIYTLNVDPTATRLNNNNMPAGGFYQQNDDPQNINVPVVTFTSPTVTGENTENRVVIKDQTGLFIDNGSFNLLKTTGGVLFPYTPVISTNHRANYELEGLVHTNYSTPYYTNSTVDSINVQGKFTCQTEVEGQYVLQMIRFFRTATKMFYGSTQNRGTPPPVLYLDAHGPWLYDHIPVVIKDFQYTLPNDVNYLTVDLLPAGKTSVPVEINITVDMTPVYSRTRISDNFDLVAFSKGNLIKLSNGVRTGGWI